MDDAERQLCAEAANAMHTIKVGVEVLSTEPEIPPDEQAEFLGYIVARCEQLSEIVCHCETHPIEDAARAWRV